MSIASRIQLADAAFAPVKDFWESRYGPRRGSPDIADLTFGNPHEMALPGLVDALRTAAEPHDKNWFAYKANEDEPRAFLAGHVSRELGLPFAPADIALTTGAFGAILVTMHLLLDPGDEAVFSEPAWFCYEPMLRAAGAVPKKVALKRPNYDLDLEAIDAAIGPRTKLVIVNTPHNPTGRIYGRPMLEQLADVLTRASARVGHPIYLLSDEPYRRLRFDDRPFVSPAAIYPRTFISYSYGKVLLSPGQRLGYLALSPRMPDDERRAFQAALLTAQMSLGWCFASAIMQHAVPHLETLTIDQAALARRRDRFVEALTAGGYRVLCPEGTFYLWSDWPEGDPDAHWDALAAEQVFVLPGSLMAAPDCFRISLTASDEMVTRALPAFAALARR